MRILLTGANGYIGKRLLPVLLAAGHTVLCCVRHRERLVLSPKEAAQVEVLELDLLHLPDPKYLPLDFDAAYYLVHSMSQTQKGFEQLERRAAAQFLAWVEASSCRQVIYLSGLVGDEAHLSAHLRSRLQVEQILRAGRVPCTVLRAGIIVGSGSASFEIIRDLSEKLPIMVAPRWIETRCQPIAIRNVIEYLTGVLGLPAALGQAFDIGGPDILTYRQMLLQYAALRGLRRWILSVPVMTPRLSAYWLYFVTSTSYHLAVNLVGSMHVEVVAKDTRIQQVLPLRLLGYREALELAFDKIQQNLVLSSWKDALVSSDADSYLLDYVDVPSYGCFKDVKTLPLGEADWPRVLDNIWAIGGTRGWYYGSWLWKMRGWLDKLAGGVGLRRGRRSPSELRTGDALDFWRVLVADRRQRRLLLYAEMKLPGEAWLEFSIKPVQGQLSLCQQATFRPKGVLGRLYWYSVLPFHFFVFNGMIRRLRAFRA